MSQSKTHQTKTLRRTTQYVTVRTADHPYKPDGVTTIAKSGSLVAEHTSLKAAQAWAKGDAIEVLTVSEFLSRNTDWKQRQ